MAGRLPRVTGAVGAVDTVDQGYFFGYTIQEPTTKSTGALVATNNKVRIYKFVLTFRATVGKIAWELETGVNSSKSGIGLYNVDGTTRLVHTGGIDTQIADQGVIQTSVTAVTLEPGVYTLALTSTSTSVIARVINLTGNGMNLVNEGATLPSFGIAANSSSSGVLPATLGVITDSTAINPAMVVFKP